MMHTFVTVGTNDLRQALTSVRAHASTDDRLPSTHRIRLAIGEQLVTVTATDSYSAGMAIVSVWERDADAQEPVTADLLPHDVAKLLSIHTGGTDKGDEPDRRLRIDVTRERITVTDCSGLIDGRALTVPRLPTDGGILCRIPDLILGQHSSPDVALVDMFAGGEILGRFKVAGAAYGKPVGIEAHSGSRALLVRVGESFLGLLMPQTIYDDGRVELAEWARGWSERLPEIAAAARSEAAEPAVDIHRVAAAGVDQHDRRDYLRAVEEVVRRQIASGPMIQRCLRIGVAKAWRLLDQMEAAGIVSPRREDGPGRDVLVPAEALDDLIAALRAEISEEPQ